MNFVVKLASLVSLLALLAQLSSALLSQQSYLIRGRKFENVTDAVIQARHFLPSHLNESQRCKRLALLLNVYNLKGDQIGYFLSARVGRLSSEDVDRRFDEIGIEKLRDLYMDGVLSFIENDQVNGAMLELHKCLSNGFRSRDVKVQAFLNDNNIKRIIEQYEFFAKQPAKLLADDSEEHSGLKLGELNPSIRKSLARLFGSDQSKLAKLFREEGEEAREHHHEGPRPTSPQTQPVNQSGASQGLPAPGYEQQALAQGHQGHHHEHQPPQQHQQELSMEEELSYLLGTLVTAYESLPLETKLNERCRTYSNLMEAKREDLHREGFVDEQIGQTAKRVVAQPSEEPFVPEETKRQSFLTVLQIFDPLQGGAETWVDLLDCVRTWEATDENVREFMKDPELVSIIDQLKAFSQEDDQTQAQPLSQTAPQPSQHPVV